MRRRQTSKPATAVLEAVFLAVFFCLLTIFSLRPNWDIDVYWHIRAGEWMVQNLALPHTDIFSATDPGRSWTTFQWLYEVLVYEVEAYFGFFWVRAMHAGLFVAAFMMLYRLFRRHVSGRVLAAFLLMLALALTEDRLRVRPGAFNLFLFVLMIPDIMRRSLDATAVIRIVLVSGLWANLHAGGALLLPLCTGALVGGRALSWLADRSDGAARRQLKGDVVRFLATALPMVLMPGFLRGVYTAFTMYEGSMVLIPEWHPPIVYFVREMAGRLTAHHVVCGFVPYLMLFGLGAVFILELRRGGWRRFVIERDAGILAVAFLLVLMGAKTARFIYLDAVALFLVAFAYRDKVERAFRSMGLKLTIIAMGGVLMGISFEYSILIHRGGLERAVDTIFEYDHEPGQFPEQAADAISAMGLKGRIFHKTSWGGYLLYRHYPGCTVFTDGRGNFTPEEQDALVATHKPYEREEALEDAWRKFGFDIVVLPNPVFPLLSWDRDDWMLAFRDGYAEVFLRLTPENSANVERVLSYWARMGIDTSGGVNAFQDEYLLVLGTQYMGRKKTRARMSKAVRMMTMPEPDKRAAGLYSSAMVLFGASRYSDAAQALDALLSMGIRHSTASLYLAWCRYLTGDIREARDALAGLLFGGEGGGVPDAGPLKWGGRRILGLLSTKTGLVSDRAVDETRLAE